MTAPVRSARQLFADEIGRAEAELNLAGAALLIAQEQYPTLCVEQYLIRLDLMAEEVQDRLANETAPLLVLEELILTLFSRHGFKGNREAYYDPRNSFLNDVLDRRLGIPLSLGTVLLEVGWRLGLPLEGVDFPSHFLVRFKGEAVDLLIDPFDGGETRFADQAPELLDRVYAGAVPLKDSYLRVATRRDILVRMLRNLKSLYVDLGDDAKALSTVERILLLRPDLPGERRAEGILLARLGRGDEALTQLQAYLDVAPDGGDDVSRIRRLMDGLRIGESGELLAGEDL